MTQHEVEDCLDGIVLDIGYSLVIAFGIFLIILGIIGVTADVIINILQQVSQ